MPLLLNISKTFLKINKFKVLDSFNEKLNIHMNIQIFITFTELYQLFQNEIPERDIFRPALTSTKLLLSAGVALLVHPW